MQNTGLSVGVGGLNETSSVHALAEGDASVALNVTPDKGGRLRKRRGTRVMRNEVFSTPSIIPYGSDTVPFTTNAGNGLLVERLAENLRVFLVGTNDLTLLCDKTAVFNINASRTDSTNLMTSVVLPGNDPRLLLLTSKTRPVQLTFLERSQYVGGGESTLVFTDVAEFANATAGNTFLLYNGRLVSGVTYTFNGLTNEVTVTFPSLPVDYKDKLRRVDLINITWQWWAEATQWYGSDFYQSSTRFNATDADINTPIKKELLTDLFPNQDDVTSQYPIGSFGFPLRAMSSASFNINVNNRDPSKQPTASNRYWFGTGAVYTPGAGAFIETAPFNFTWGALQPGGLPTRLYQHRYRELRMRNGKGVPGTDLRVFVNSVPFTQNLTDTPTFVPTADSYHLRNKNGTILSSTSAKAELISFTGTDPTGLSYNQRVEIIDVGAFPKLDPGDLTGLGGSAVDQRSWDWLPVDGGYYPVFGLHNVSSFQRQLYPTTGCLFQGRLVLGGFAGNPNLCVASAVRDTRTPNNGSFNHFMVNDAFVENTDAFAFVVSTDTSDAVVALTVWNETLVALTRNGVYVSYAKGDNTFGVGNAELVRTSRRGIINRKAFAAMSSMLVYVSEQGVETVGTAAQSSEQGTLSDKIKGRFNLYGGARYAHLTRVGYLEKTNAFYFFVPVEPCRDFNWEVLVLNVDTMGWTNYRSTFGFPVHDVAVVEDSINGQTMITSMTTLFTDVNSNVGKANHLHLKWEDGSRSVDYVVQTSVSSGVVQPYTQPVHKRFVQHFFDGTNYILPTSFDKTGQVRGFDLLPYTNVCDAAVWVGGTPLQFTPGGVPDQGRFSKLPNGDIVINVNNTTLVGQLVNIYLRQPATIYLD